MNKKITKKHVAVILAIICFIICLSGGLGLGSQMIRDQNKEPNITEVLPDIEKYFPDGHLSVLDGDDPESYICEIKGYSVDEWAAFVEACKENGFTDVYWENNWPGEESFGATSDGEGKYWLDTHINHDRGIVYILCQISYSYHKEHLTEE